MRKWFHVTQADFEGAFGQIKFLFLVSEFLEAGILAVRRTLLQSQDTLCSFLQFRHKYWPTAGARIFS